LASVERAAQTADVAGVERLRESLARHTGGHPEAPGSDGRNFHVVVAEVARNRVVALLMRVLVKATIELDLHDRHWHDGDGAGLLSTSNGGADAHRAVVDAIAAGDVALARRRMSQHLEVLDRHLMAQRPMSGP
jgi:DNA-binding FadR family transcriptional regulator